MKRIFLPVLFCLSFMALSRLSAQEPTIWSYYNTWCMGSDDQWELFSRPYYISPRTFAANIGRTTHVIVFMGNEIIKSDHIPYYSITADYARNGGSSTDSVNFLWNGVSNPQSGPTAWQQRGGIETLRDLLHAKGKKILVCLQAVNARAFSDILADSARTQILVNAIWRYNVDHNFDGVNLNVENNERFTDAQFVAFFRMLDRSRPAGQLISAVPPATQWKKYVNVVGYVDYILPQFYSYVSNWQVTPTCSGGRGNGVFLKAPLYLDGIPAGSNHQSLQTWGPNQWRANGWPASKIVVLMSNEANPFSGGDALFTCAGYSTHFWADTLAYFMLGHGGQMTWDAVHIGGYIHGTSDMTVSFQGGTIRAGEKFIIPVLTDRNIDTVVAWSAANGYTNFGLYDIATDTRSLASVKNPRLRHLAEAVRRLIPQPPPTSKVVH